MIESRRHHSSAWLRQRCQRLAAQIDAGDLIACGHAGALVVSLWEQPLQLRCRSCVIAANVAFGQLDPAEDSSCDRCRRLVDDVVPLVLAWGPLLVQLGLCRACFGKETGRDALG